MKKGLLFTLVLFILVIGGIFYLLHEKGRDPAPVKDEKAQEAPAPLIRDLERLKSFSLISDKLKLTFEKNQTYFMNWKMTEPLVDEVDPDYFGLLLRSITEMKKEKIVNENPLDLSLFHLDTPVAEVVFRYDDEAHPETRILLGDLNPFQTQVYAKEADSPAVFLTPKIILRFFNDNPVDFRNRYRILTDNQSLSAIDITIDDPQLREKYPQNDGTKMIAQSQPEGVPQWIIVEPVHENVTNDNIKQFLFVLNHTVAAKVIDNPQDVKYDFGLNPPKAVFEFTYADGGKQFIKFGSLVEGENVRFVSNSLHPAVFTVPEYHITKLFELDLRNPYLVQNENINNYNRVQVSFRDHPEKNFTIIKKAPKQYAFEDDPEKLIFKRSRIWLSNNFVKERVTRYISGPVNLADYGLDNPALIVKWLDGENMLSGVALGNTTGDPVGTYAMNLKNNYVAWYNKDIYFYLPLERKNYTVNPKKYEFGAEEEEDDEEEMNGTGTQQGTTAERGKASPGR